LLIEEALKGACDAGAKIEKVMLQKIKWIIVSDVENAKSLTMMIYV